MKRSGSGKEDVPPSQIDFEIDESVRRLEPTASAGGIDNSGVSQCGPGACQEFTRAERRGDLVVGTEFECHDLVRFVADPVWHHLRYHRLLAQGARDRHAVFAGEAKAEKDEVDGLLGDKGQVRSILSRPDATDRTRAAMIVLRREIVGFRSP